MGRLIEADKLKEELGKSWAFENTLYDVCRIINEAPTIDAVEVVRCKGCKHCHYEQEDDVYHCHKLFHRFYDTEHYCSYGERKEHE